MVTSTKRASGCVLNILLFVVPFNKKGYRRSIRHRLPVLSRIFLLKSDDKSSDYSVYYFVKVYAFGRALAFPHRLNETRQ